MSIMNRRPNLLLAAAGLLPAVTLAVAAGGTRAGLWHFRTGLLMLPAAGVVGILIVIVALWLLRRSRRVSTGPTAAACVTAAVLAATPAVYVGQQILTARSLPLIHDISTDLEEPPVFRSGRIRSAERDNSLEFDAAATAELQREAYPDVVPFETSAGCDAAFASAYNGATDAGWDVAEADPGTGYVEATATTRFFGFRDDVVVRLRDADGGCRIDMRSVSRVGLSDVGANANRIRAFMATLRAALGD